MLEEPEEQNQELLNSKVNKKWNKKFHALNISVIKKSCPRPQLKYDALYIISELEKLLKLYWIYMRSYASSNAYMHILPIPISQVSYTHPYQIK